MKHLGTGLFIKVPLPSPRDDEKTCALSPLEQITAIGIYMLEPK